MLLYKAVIPLDPRTKKNHQMIAGTGPRCPICRKPARQFIRHGTILDEYERKALPYITGIPPEPLAGPVHVKYHFYMGTRRKVDDLNLCGEVDDMLVSCKILADDNSKVIRSHDGTRVFYDKQNPRTEIYIYEYKEEEDAEIN